MSEETQTTLRDQLSEAFSEHVEGETTVVAETQQPAVEPAKVESDTRTAEERARDEKGRFTEAEKAAKPASKQVPGQTQTRPPRPSSWKKDYEADWEKLDPRLAEYINQRESEYAKGVSTYKQEWDRAKPILDAITPFAPHFQKYGIQPDQWIKSLGAAHQALALGNPQQKLQMFARLAQDYGVPLQALLPRPQIGSDGKSVQQAPVDPRLAMIWNELQKTRGEVTQWKTAQEQREAEQIQNEITAFQGDGKHPHYETVKTMMADLLEKGLAKTLEEAYSLSLRMPQHDDIWTAMQEEKRKAQEAEKLKAAQAARKKAVSLKSSSPGSAAAASGGKKSLREELTEAVESVSTGRI